MPIMVSGLTNHLERHKLITQDSVELAIGKALLEEEFRNLLFAKPDEALSGFNLTSAEKSRLLRVDSETLEFLAQILNRMSSPQ